MTKQLLIYGQAVPVNKDRHRDWSVKSGKDFEFARGLNSVPLTAVEFPNAAAEYAIVFAGTDEQIMPMVIMGVREQENLYITEGGNMDARYIPAFLRRYPFVFSSTDDGANFTLCIDEAFTGCNQEGRGERFFDAEGERTLYLDKVLEFLKQYQVQFQRTQAFCKRLQTLDLLEPMQAQFTLSAGQQMSLTGFMAVNRDRLKGLSGEQLKELAETGDLELVYTHLQSMRNISLMAERMSPTEAEQKPAETEQLENKVSEEAGRKKKPAGTEEPSHEELH